MNANEIDQNTKPPAYLYPPKDHKSEDFRLWCMYAKNLGYADQYIAAVSGESVNRIRRLIGKCKKRR